MPIAGGIDFAVGQTHQPVGRAVVAHQVDVAVGHVDGGAEAPPDLDQRVLQVERRRELEAGLGHERHAPGGLFDLGVQRRVGERLGGDLGEPVQHRHVGEVARPFVEHLGEADHLGARDERDHEARMVPEAPPLGAFHLAGAPLGGHVGDDDRLATLHGEARDVHVGEAVDGPDELEVDRTVRLDAGEAHLDVALKGVDVAAARVGRGAHAGGHRAQHFVHLEAGAELETGVDQLAQLAVALLEALEQEGFLEGAGQELADAAHEVEVLGVGALAGVFDVDHGDRLAVHDERDGEAALQAPALVPVDLVGRKPGVVGRADDPGLALLERRGETGVVRERRPPAVVGVVEAVGPDADELHQLVAVDLVDVAGGGLQRDQQAQRDEAQELVDIGRRGDELTERHQVAQGGVALLELAQQQCVLGGPGQHRREALQEPGDLAEVARSDVEDVEKADRLAGDHERHADLALVVELGVALALVVGESRVVAAEAMTSTSCRASAAALAGKVADVAGPADPRVDHAVAVEAGQQLDAIALQRVELAGVGVDRLDQPRAQRAERGLASDAPARSRRARRARS